MSPVVSPTDKFDIEPQSIRMTQQDLEKIWTWNKVLPKPIEQCVHSIFEAKAQDQPDALAICSWDGELTYGELDQCATRLAYWLKDQNVGAGSMIPLLFDKSMWMTVAILGVLKAGGAFVSLDPSSPRERLLGIVQQADARLILSSVSNLSLGLRCGRHVMAVDRSFLMSLESQDNRQLPPVSPSSTMCLQFTSGSTGAPKGAKITHRNLASALYHQAKHLGFTAESRIYDFSTYGFDASMGQTFTALAEGACLCVPREHDRKNALARSITSLRANVVALTPSVAQLLAPQDIPTVHTVLFIGEPLCVRDVERWWGKVRVVNIYGPSECTPYAVLNSYPSCLKETTRIGIGAGAVTWIVHPNNHDDLLPIGETGELLLEGPLVGEGYWNDPGRTGMAFIHYPMWLQRGAVGYPGRHGKYLYKTGDLVHYNEDGSLTYVGRKDTQVKIHGQRTELGEIEHCLRKHLPEAKQIVAEIILSEGESPGPVLVAFALTCDMWTKLGRLGITCAPQILHIPKRIEDELYERLPAHMVPTIFFSMREFPLTATGKLDRRKLREIGTSCFWRSKRKLKQVTNPKSRSDIELKLQIIVGQALGIDPAMVELEDNFFKLGGNSITAMRIVSEAEKAGIELTVSDIFKHPSLDSLIKQCHPLVGKASERILPFSLLGDSADKSSLLQAISAQYQLDVALIEDAYPCTPLQEGLLSLSLNTPGEYLLQQTLELRPTVHIRNFCRAWDTMVQKMAILRTRIVHPGNMGPLQVVLNEEIQWHHATGLDAYLEEDQKVPMDLGKPLARYALVTDSSSTRLWFVWTLHHAVYDAWSLSLMIDMVNQAFSGIPIAPPEHEFKSFINYIGAQNSEKVAQHWRDILTNCDCVTFPTLPPSILHPVVDSEITLEIPWLDRRSGDVTTSTLIRAACALVIGFMTSSDNVVFGVTTSGRGAPLRGIGEVVGPTIATVPLSVRIEQSQRVLDCLSDLQKQTTEMIPFEQFGLHRIAKVSPEAHQACMFQTILIIQAEEYPQTDFMLGEWHETSKPEWVNTFALAIKVKIAMKMVVARFDSNVVKPWVVETLLDGLALVMKQLDSAGLEQCIGNIEIVTPKSIDRIWNWNSVVPSPVETRIQDIIARSAQSRPTATAICAWDGPLTYGELDRLATKIADHLVRLGTGTSLLGPDILVPLCFEKSKWAVVAMLGVLKAGVGFVLLEPSLPEARLQSIIKKVDAKILLSSQENMALSMRLSSMVVQIGPDLSKIPSHVSNHSTCLTQQRQTFSKTMYAVFTSGSTGAPKGVLVSHENFSSAVHYQSSLLRFDRESRVLDFASYAFDAAIHNVMATLATGGCLCIPSEKDRTNDIGSVMVTMRPTIANLTPTVTRLLDPETVHSLKTLILLGEPVTVRDAEQWRSHNVHLINTYGPAECTPISTINPCASCTEEATRIGKGVGLVTWVVNPKDHHQLLPPGCTGELLLEGPLVGDGYMGDPEKTAEVFIESPDWLLKGSCGQPGRHGRLYKTGDLVQYNEDGSLTFMGRKDSQVKIRGQRFELEEVEHWIRLCFSRKHHVATEIVVPQGERHVEPVLVAFIQVYKKAVNAVDHPLAADIKRRLALQLPSYMIPAVFFSVSEIPLTPTGKMNRRRLREMGEELLSVRQKRVLDTSDQSVGNGFPGGSSILEAEQPVYALAQKIYSMCPSWTQNNLAVCKGKRQHQQVELHDIHLHLSGLDSVNMMELSSFISQNFNVRVVMQYLMDKATTIRSLARFITEAQCAGDSNGRTSTYDHLTAEINRLDTRVSIAQRLASYNINSTPSSMDGYSKPFIVLLTGATGFIGTQILRQLLEDIRVGHVICLVRGDTDNEAKDRIIKKAVQALWWTPHHVEKLEAWQGDLSLPHLGLDERRWTSISSGQVANAIIHCGATVHWTKSYQVLEAANVGSTIDLLLLVIGLPRLRMLYVTGGRSWNSYEELDVLKELSVPGAIPYSQTKFVAEAVIRRAARRNPSVAGRIGVLNPGWVIGTPAEGFSNTEDYIWRLVAACIRIGAYNADQAAGWVSLSDAATTATAIVDAALGIDMGVVSEEHTDGMIWKDLWEIVQTFGYELKPTSMPKWMDLVRADLSISRDRHPLWPLAHLLEELQNDERVASSSLERRSETSSRLNTAVSRCVEFLIGVGFLPMPPKTQEAEQLVTA